MARPLLGTPFQRVPLGQKPDSVYWSRRYAAMMIRSTRKHIAWLRKFHAGHDQGQGRCDCFAEALGRRAVIQAVLDVAPRKEA